MKICNYRKNSDIQNICCNHPKILPRWLYQRVMHLKDADGIANSVDPDQEQSDLDLQCLPRKICPKTNFRIITVSIVNVSLYLKIV